MTLPVIRVPGPLTIKWNSTDLGETLQGATIRIEDRDVPIICDSYGETTIDMIHTGRNATVEIIALEWQKVRAAQLDGDDTDKITIGTIGALAQAQDGLAQKLEIGQNDGKTWVANKAKLTGVRETSVRATQPLQVTLVFQILPDDNDKLFATIPSYTS